MIRKAIPADFEEIHALEGQLIIQENKIFDQEYRQAVEKNGFLLKIPFPREKFLQAISKTLLVEVRDKKVVGLIRIDENEPPNLLRKSTVLNKKLFNAYTSKPHSYVGRIGVLPAYRLKGIASSLYAAAEEKLLLEKIQFVFSFVMASPVLNFSSVQFHEKNGFIKVDISEKFPFAGFSEYQSYLFGKKLF